MQCRHGSIVLFFSIPVSFLLTTRPVSPVLPPSPIPMDHHHHHQYPISDLPHYRPLFPPPPSNPYDILLTPTTTTACFTGLETTLAGGGPADGGAGRWPRQETLTLLEIRSRLDQKFKEANQKGPLWDEVARIMSEEHGYQRSGKKCREKFENLYKYYKKTKEGKAGRQDGKHYRFFRQLEALYGDSNSNKEELHNVVTPAAGNFHYNCPNQTTPLPINQEYSFQGQKLSDTSLSLSNYSDDDDDTTSSDDTEGMIENDPHSKKRGKRGWKVKIRDFIDSQMKKLMERQEAWMDKMMKTMEQKEQERLSREDEWRKQDAARMDKEQKFWANERAWIESRDAALMEALQKLTRSDHLTPSPTTNDAMVDNGSQTMSGKGEIWGEEEITRLVQLRSAMEVKFEERGRVCEELVWEEIATKMGCYGHDRTGVMCKHKWDSINNYLLKCNKKRKEDSKGCSTSSSTYYQQRSHELQQQQQQQLGHDHHPQLQQTAVGNSGGVNDNCLRYFMGNAYGRIMD